MSMKGLVVDPITNYPSLHHKNCIERRITDEILGVKGLRMMNV